MVLQPEQALLALRGPPVKMHAQCTYTFVYILSTDDEIILHHVHFCAAKAYGCFASKTVDLSFASDIPQSAYNSALAYQQSNLPLLGNVSTIKRSGGGVLPLNGFHFIRLPFLRAFNQCRQVLGRFLNKCVTLG